MFRLECTLYHTLRLALVSLLRTARRITSDVRRNFTGVAAALESAVPLPEAVGGDEEGSTSAPPTATPLPCMVTNELKATVVKISSSVIEYRLGRARKLSL